MTDIEAGALVLVRTADGQKVRRRAVSPVEETGHDFPVVWVTTEQEWADAEGNGHTPEARPWPAEDVELAEDENEVAFRVVQEATGEDG